MDFLSREASPLSEALWKQIDSTVVGAATRVLIGRRFLKLFGPLGIGVQHISVDDADHVEQVAQDGLITTRGRKVLEIPMIYDDFLLYARDLEAADRSGFPVDLSKAAAAAEACALKEDKLIFFGDNRVGYDGLLTVPGANKIERKDWSTGENAFSDIAAALELLTEKGIYGPYALALSPDLYMQMQRIQPGTGLLEIDRVSKLVGGHVFKSPVLGKGKAVLVASDERNMDLVVGQDMATAYLEQTELNHRLRVLETVLLRIKRSQAIVVFE
ncbi:family 1 encapsulin nanocompartment shell protein [Thermoclostridium caenicola]|uniref:Type 1 encapsulin shell protein n=1 Tax=Thermoclostridium caenicola TaxID=659425 RepID=A0A1M6DY91_9FIRM|nr:family 1 encapsulin nanocompartment shell protein [Thermoclostridium caenicola]SHI78119.1 Uncharacterized protein, linocin/CFP29 family [Thermoclostridium caenicola]HOP72246.1 family 1 encapsulin nanocompartment shell protein [Thermoclostridium caenicola]